MLYRIYSLWVRSHGSSNLIGPIGKVHTYPAGESSENHRARDRTRKAAHRVESGGVGCSRTAGAHGRSRDGDLSLSGLTRAVEPQRALGEVPLRDEPVAIDRTVFDLEIGRSRRLARVRAMGGQLENMRLKFYPLLRSAVGMRG